MEVQVVEHGGERRKESQDGQRKFAGAEKSLGILA